MDTQQLKLFVAVAEAGSIHGGARTLMIAQPAVSKALRKLERQVGTTLLVRSSHGVELTAAGDLLREHAISILERLGRAEEDVYRRGEASKSLTVGLIASSVAAGELTSPIIQAFRGRHPDVSVVLRELDYTNQFESLVRGDVDVALVRPPSSDSRIRLTPLFDEPILLCCHREHRLAVASTVRVADVMDEPMLGLEGAPQDWVDFWQLASDRGERLRTDMSVRTHAELGLTLAVNVGTVMTMAQSAWRISPRIEDLRVLAIHGGPRSEVSAASRVGDGRELIESFLDVARTTCRAELARVDDASLLVS